MKLSQELFRDVRNYLYEESGLYYANYKKYLLEGRLLKRVNELNMSSFREYINYIRGSSAETMELSQIYQEIAKSESCFFQNTAQLKTLTGWVIPEIQKNHAGKSLHIASLTGDNGEEVYTLSILLHDYFGKDLPNWNIRILKLDDDSDRITKAKQGEYEPYAIRNTSRKYILDYFDKIGSGYRMKAQIRSLVSIQRYTTPEDLKDLGEFDVLFCRNRLLSLGYNQKQSLIYQLENILRWQGILFLGQMETLHNLKHSLELCHFPNTLAYVKKIQGNT